MADVASGEKNLMQTLEELDVLAKLGATKAEQIASKGRTYLVGLQAVKQVMQTREDVVSAFTQFISGISRQGDLAEKHALAFLDFSKAETDPASVIGGLARNQDFADAVGTIVLNRTNDTKRANAARELISTVTK